MLLLQRHQQLQHLQLHGQVQCRGGLIQHQQAGLEHQRPRNGHPLALSAREFMRIAVQHQGRIQPHFLQRVDHRRAVRVVRQIGPVQPKPLPDDLGNAHPRRERIERILEHHLEAGPQRTQRALGQRVDARAGHAHLAVHLAGSQAHQHQRQRGLAGAGFAHHPQRGAGRHLQVHVLQHLGPFAGKPALLADEGAAHLACTDHETGIAKIFRAGRRLRHGLHQSLRMGRQQRPGVFVPWGVEHPGHWPLFHHPAVAHHHHLLGKGTHQRQVVRDQQHRHAELLLQVGQQLHDAGLHRHVQRRGGLIGNHQLRPAGQRHGNQRPLPLPARELVRVRGRTALRILDARQPQQFQRAFQRLGACQPLVLRHHLADLVADGVQRVQRRHGFLKHHAHLPSPQLVQRTCIGREDVASLEQHAAPVLRALGQPHQRMGRERLARARFAHQRHALARPHRKAHVLHDACRRSVGPRQVDAQVAHVQQGPALGRLRCLSRYPGRVPFIRHVVSLTVCAGPAHPAAPRR